MYNNRFYYNWVWGYHSVGPNYLHDQWKEDKGFCDGRTKALALKITQ
jgi:hypothetical protein